jgi:hypothetical protein
MMKDLLFAAVLVASALTSVSAVASPWLLSQGDLVLVGRFDFERGNEEFLDTGPAQNFPLRGSFGSTTFSTNIRYGILDSVELEINIPIKQVSYVSDTVILLDGGPEEGIDFYQDNTINLSKRVEGLADIEMAGRYQLFTGAVRGAFEFRLKTPTGYDPPSGTFGDNPKSQDDFLSNAGTFVSPENVRDDVTLGDGQLDLTPSLLFGAASSKGTFSRLGVGYRMRFGGAGDQLVGNFYLGQSIGQRLLFFAGCDLELALQEGRIIGISVAAEDPLLPARDYAGTKNLLLREVSLDRDQVRMSLGAILRVTPLVELNLGYGRTLWGENTTLVEAFSIGIGVRTNILGE